MVRNAEFGSMVDFKHSMARMTPTMLMTPSVLSLSVVRGLRRPMHQLHGHNLVVGLTVGKPGIETPQPLIFNVNGVQGCRVDEGHQKQGRVGCPGALNVVVVGQTAGTQGLVTP
jgi:hypothetical protein